MKTLKLLIAGIIACGSLSAYAQKSNISASSLVAKAHQQGKAFLPRNIITPEATSSNLKSRLSSSVSEFGTFTLNREELKKVKEASNDYITLSMPLPDGFSAQVELVKVNITTADFSVITPKGIEAVETGQHYRGIINNDPKTLAAISIFGNEISGTLSIPEKGDYTIGLVRSPEAIASGTHIIYNILSYKGTRPDWRCETKDDKIIPYSAKQLSSDPNSAIIKYTRLYYETEYDMYTSLGTVAAVSNFMVGLHNQAATLYANEGISVLVSQVFVWNVEDPYNGANTSANLSAFQSVRTSFYGDLGQLETFRGIGGGLAAGFSGLCNATTANKLSTAQLYSFYNTVPTYSWSVYVVTHEFGHLFGSRHTHACVWNGNGTAIDGCSGFTEGGCPLPGIPAGGGTIMSYCHLQSVGINFSLGFGPQPGSVIRNSVANAPCLITNCQLGATVSWIDCYARTNCGWTTFNTYPRKMGDVNGDGKADIIGFGAAGVYVSYSTGSAFGTPFFALAAYGTGAGGWSSFDTYPREVADVNGDGKADIIGFGAAGVYVSYSTGSGFTTPAYVLANFGTGAGGWTNYNTYPRKMGDVNGDGKADIIGFGAAGVYVSYSTGSGFTAPAFVLANFGTAAGGWSSFDTYPREIADVNGDGKADIIGFGAAGVYVSYSTGSGFTTPAYVLANFGTAAGGWTNYNTYPRTVADLNGDGKADIIGFGAAGVYLSSSNGSGFAAPAFILASFGTGAGGWVNYDTYPRTLADVNGDGKKDIIGFGEYSTYVSLSYCSATATPLASPVNADDVVEGEFADNNMNENIKTNTDVVYTEMTGNLSTLTSIGNSNNDHSITVYPNPAKESITFHGLKQAGRVEILNTLGQVVLRKDISDPSSTINLSNIESGVYYIQFLNSMGEKIKGEKLIIE